jgi:hypothetical protein
VRRGWKGDFELVEIAGSRGPEWISKELPKLQAQGYVRVGNHRFFKKPASVIAKKKGTKGTAAKKPNAAAKKAPAKKKAQAAAPAPARTGARKRVKVSHDEFEESEVESEDEDNDDGDSDFE